MSPTNNSLQICRLLLHIIFLHRHRTKLIYDNLLYIFVIRADQVLSTDNVWVWICRICHRLEYTHTTGEGKYFFPVHFFSSSLFPPCRFLGLSAITQENHLIIFIDNYQRQTPCKQRSRAAATMLPIWTNTEVSSSSSETQPPDTAQASSVASLLEMRASIM